MPGAQKESLRKRQRLCVCPLATPEASPRPGHPAVLVATLGGIGRLPLAPGTWGSLAALPVAWAIVELGGVIALAACIAGLFPLGIWACNRYAAMTGIDDPGACVVDEVVGQWVVLLVLPLDPAAYAAGFALFRLFDILKPWPVGWADRRLRGGFGVMFDDVLAGLQGALLAWAVPAIYHALV